MEVPAAATASAEALRSKPPQNFESDLAAKGTAVPTVGNIAIHSSLSNGPAVTADTRPQDKPPQHAAQPPASAQPWSTMPRIDSDDSSMAVTTNSTYDAVEASAVGCHMLPTLAPNDINGHADDINGHADDINGHADDLEQSPAPPPGTSFRPYPRPNYSFLADMSVGAESISPSPPDSLTSNGFSPAAATQVRPNDTNSMVKRTIPERADTSSAKRGSLASLRRRA